VNDLIVTRARVFVIALLPSPALLSLADEGEITLYQEAYQSGMLAALSPLLLFAATDSSEVNRQVVEEARAVGAIVNMADDSAESDFHSMATIKRGEITVGISTASPVMSGHLKHKLEQVIGDEYVIMAQWMKDLRPTVKARIPTQKARAAFWRSVMESNVLTMLKDGDEAGAREVLEGMVEGIEDGN
jgi:precorrin-2 dehydrogenase / sirohydrochlorin ferrochelatase